MPAAFVATSALIMYPACAMDEYASIRLIFVCRNAMRLPPTTETAASTAIRCAQYAASTGNATKRTRRRTAMPAAFEHMASSPVTGAGAPS